jgi:dihydropyrimidinase
MQVDLVVRNARIIRHDGEFHGGVAIQDGRIVATGDDAALPGARRTIDAKGLVLMPGVVDPHCHLGFEYDYADDVRTEMAAAAIGGVTTALDYIQVLDEDYRAFYRDRRGKAEANSPIDFGYHFIIQREDHIARLPEMVETTGVKSFKFYFGYEPNNPIGLVPATDGWIYAAMRLIAKIPGGIINVHCENTAIGTWLKREMQETGRQDLAAFTDSRPAFCEVETIRRMIFLAERTGCPLHLVHTSVGMGPVLAQQSQRAGFDVTVETCPHYLTRTCTDPDLDIKAKIMPPLRDKTEQEGLWRGMFDGSVCHLGTDHVPFFPKQGTDIWRMPPGAVGFQWELPLMLEFGAHRRGLPLTRLVELNAANPAKRFGLWPRKGTIGIGADADLILVDLDAEKTVRHTGKGTCIYEGWNLRGWPVMTIARGRVIAENGTIDESAIGTGLCLTAPA